MTSTISVASKRPDGMITQVPPSSRHGSNPLTPAMWHSERPESHTSPSPVMPCVEIFVYVFSNRLACVRTAPFGRPVVPDV